MSFPTLSGRTSLIALLAFSALPTTHGQTLIDVGTGIVLNSPFQSPSTYSNTQNGARNQLLFLASELQAAGMTAGTISSLAFNVEQNSGTTLENFTIQLGTTTASSLTETWEGGLVDVLGPLSYTDQVGWNTHELTTTFSWDGVSNLVLQTCNRNLTTSFNATMYQSVTSFTSCVSRNSPNPTICSDGGGTHFLFQQRPNVRFGWSPLEAPPVANFNAAPTFTCTGTVTFTDHSLNGPTAWEWDFGDATTGSGATVEHAYTASGTYTATLTVTNDFGTDVATSVPIVVDLSSTAPIAACAVTSIGSVAGFGILEVQINDQTFPSSDAATEGYLDNTCATNTVVQGIELQFSITPGSVADHAVRGWIDWDNSGTFTSNESIISTNGIATLNGSVVVPATATLDTPLRMRVVAAYALVTPDPWACDDLEYGQAEDYSITVLENTSPPIAAYTVSPAFSCTGEVQFTDLSLNAPTGWTWDFGDDTGSNERSPSHTYLASGTYTVGLTVINANGEDSEVIEEVLTVDLAAQLSPAACTPNTQSYCCGYGVLGFQFAGIESVSTDGSEGYQDRSCGNVADVQEGLSYTWSVTTGDEAPHDTRIWIDLDNDGAFAGDELLVTALDQISPSGSVTIPQGSVYDAPLRLRVQSDVIGQSTGPCAEPLYGQTEDFSARVQQSTEPPVAAFSADPTTTCDGVVQFTDASMNVATSWSWNFGDGGTSTEQNPLYTYDGLGDFTVSLTTTNAFGSDTQTLNAYIHHVPGWQCDTLEVDGDVDQSSTECAGVLADDGGPFGNYSGGTSGAFTISPTDAELVTLSFSQFNWGNNPNRELAVYDGPTVGSPLIFSTNGTGLGQLPDNGVITSSGPSITLRQEQIGGGGPPPNNSGFLLTWNCSFTGVPEVAADPILSIRPQPADDWFIVDLSAQTRTHRSLTISDAVGRIVGTINVPNNAASIPVDASAFPGGVYVLQLTTGSQHWTRTLLIR